SSSRTTYENAVESARLLNDRDMPRVVLVTDAAHLRRAVACFRKQGLDVIPCGSHYRALGRNRGPAHHPPRPPAAPRRQGGAPRPLRAAGRHLVDRSTTEMASAPTLPATAARPRVIVSFDVEEHYRIEAAVGLTVDPARKAAYAERMEDSTRWLLDCLAARNI